jgi:hypothetical protein
MRICRPVGTVSLLIAYACAFSVLADQTYVWTGNDVQFSGRFSISDSDFAAGSFTNVTTLQFRFLDANNAANTLLLTNPADVYPGNDFGALTDGKSLDPGTPFFVAAWQFPGIEVGMNSSSTNGTERFDYVDYTRGVFFNTTGTWTLQTISRPINDNFADRTVLPTGVVSTSALFIDSGPPPVTNVFTFLGASVSGSLSNATSEANEPLIPGISSGQTAWWTWTAPSNGIVTLSWQQIGGAVLPVPYGNVRPVITVFTGDSLADLSLVASNTHVMCYEHTECGCHWRERDNVTFHVAAGQSYQICFDSPIYTETVEPAPGTNVLQTTNTYHFDVVFPTLQFTPAPANDDFENRTPLLFGFLQGVFVSNLGATRQDNEPEHGGHPGGSSVWYSLTAQASGRVTLSTSQIPVLVPPSTMDRRSVSIIKLVPPLGLPPVPSCGEEIEQNPVPFFHPIFAVYTGSSLDSLVPAGCRPLPPSAYPHGVEFDVVSNQTYQIAFDGNEGTVGSVTMFVEFTPAPSNDDFSNAIKLRGRNLLVTGHNAGATHESGEPEPLDGSEGKSVWWSWKAPRSGPVSIDLGGSDYSFPVGVYTVAPPRFHFGNFSAKQGIHLTGDALFTKNKTLRLTPAAFGTTGNAWLAQQQPCASAFSTRFHFRMRGSDSAFGNGDGITFSVQNVSPDDLVWAATNATNNYVSVFFNTFWNWPGCTCPDVSGNSAGILLNNNYVAQTDLTPLGIQLSDGNVHEARIDSDSESLTVSIDGKAVLSNVPMPGMQPGTDQSGRGWIGFTAACGYAYETHDILDWTFDSAGSPLSRLQSVGSGDGNTIFQATAGQTYYISVSDSDGLTGKIQMILQAP